MLKKQIFNPSHKMSHTRAVEALEHKTGPLQGELVLASNNITSQLAKKKVKQLSVFQKSFTASASFVRTCLMGSAACKKAVEPVAVSNRTCSFKKHHLLLAIDLLAKFYSTNIFTSKCTSKCKTRRAHVQRDGFETKLL